MRRLSKWFSTGERNDYEIGGFVPARSKLRLRGELHESEPGEERTREPNMHDSDHNDTNDNSLSTRAHQRSVFCLGLLRLWAYAETKQRKTFLDQFTFVGWITEKVWTILMNFRKGTGHV